MNKKLKDKLGKEVKIFNDEIMVEFISALGQYLGRVIIPIKMKDLLIKAYIDSLTIKSTYMFINGEEITNNINYNPFYIKSKSD